VVNTKLTNSEIPHHLHLAKHEGYKISRRPTEFIERYGRYALTILRMLKFGISVAGVALSGNLQKGLFLAIGYLEKVTAGHAEGADDILDRMENNEALEGAGLRKLKSFLKNKDGNRTLGNLDRTQEW
jgi:hypothetical protein